MIRRTNNSHIHGHKVVKLPKCTLAWAEFITPAKLVKQIDIFRKQVSKDEREDYVKAIKKWKLANTNKPANQSSQQPTAPLAINRKTAPPMRLRVLADFPGLIHHLFDIDGQLIPSVFTLDLSFQRPIPSGVRLSHVMVDGKCLKIRPRWSGASWTDRPQEVGQSLDLTKHPRKYEVDLCRNKACTAMTHGSNPHSSWLRPSSSSTFAAQAKVRSCSLLFAKTCRDSIEPLNTSLINSMVTLV